MQEGIIWKMTEELASKIAAGEVVDRPASVVKELVENSVDASAHLVHVETVNGGLSLISVRDDGLGMNCADVMMSVVPHATSKLRRVEDLFALQTLGFRGEALSSIASVSHMNIASKSRTDDTGFLMEFEAGAPKGQGQQIGGAIGTRIEVHDLFYNVPARRKFLKRPELESSHIYEVMVRLALCYPHVAFVYVADGKKWLDLPACHGLLERAEAIFCKKEKDQNHRLYGFENQHNGWQLELCASGPSWTFSTAKNMYLLINGRFVRDRSVQHAALSAYGEVLPKGRFPLLVLSMLIPPHTVDVNVHPQKLEVRFLEPDRVYSWVKSSVKQLVIRSPWLTYRQQSPQSEVLTQPFLQDSVFGVIPAQSTSFTHSNTPKTQPFLTAKESTPAYQTSMLPNEVSIAKSDGMIKRGFFSQWRYIGQLHKTYLLCEGDHELILVDQHAAHEALAYQRLQVLHRDSLLKKQQLLFPIQRDIPPAEQELVQEALPLFEALGFDVRLFGEHTAVLSAVPDAKVFGRGAKCYLDPEVLFDKVMGDLAKDKKNTTVDQRIDTLLATIACHSVIRAGDLVEPAAAYELLRQLDEVDIPPYCPHGRPVLVRLSRGDIERRFGRS